MARKFIVVDRFAGISFGRTASVRYTPRELIDFVGNTCDTEGLAKLPITKPTKRIPVKKQKNNITHDPTANTTIVSLLDGVHPSREDLRIDRDRQIGRLRARVFSGHAKCTRVYGTKIKRTNETEGYWVFIGPCPFIFKRGNTKVFADKYPLVFTDRWSSSENPLALRNSVAYDCWP